MRLYADNDCNNIINAYTFIRMRTMISAEVLMHSFEIYAWIEVSIEDLLFAIYPIENMAIYIKHHSMCDSVWMVSISKSFSIRNGQTISYSW